MVYNLPVHIRRYCLKLLSNAKEEEKKQIDEQSKKGKSGGSTPKIPNAVGQAMKSGAPTRRPPPKK